ncbi:MAG TPA: HAMP domain-containing sensor histidine kinase [Longimicrobiales bacterium]|nr:HAMP domain-containing sensor histidine kinase [Longimicrobiales bacterium]
MATATMELAQDLRLLVVSPKAPGAHPLNVPEGAARPVSARVHWERDLGGARARLTRGRMDAVLLDDRIADGNAEALDGLTEDVPVLVVTRQDIDEIVSLACRSEGPIRVVPSMGRAHILAHLIQSAAQRRKALQTEWELSKERAARTAAEWAAHRFRTLADSSANFFATLDYTETLSTLAHQLVNHLADWVVIYVVDDSGAVGRLEMAHRDPAKELRLRELRDQTISPDQQHPVLDVIRSGEPAVAREVDESMLDDLDIDPNLGGIIKELGVRSAMVLPLIARGRVLGAITMVSTSTSFDDNAVSLANEVAFRAALALDNARLYREARRANEEKTQLLAVISHDLRTPLTSIIGYADLFTMGIPETLSDHSLQQVERIRTAAKHLLYLIEELLAFTRADADGAELQLREVIAQEVVYEVTSLMHPMAMEQGLDFQLRVPGDRIVLRTDPGKLRQILLNLTGNAVKFTDDGYVRLELESEDGTVTFRVCDSGIGIDPENVERIFKPFWQVHGTRAQGGGTGLGLSVVRRLVTSLHGEISVESKPGEGSVFTVELPRLIVGPREPSEQKPTAPLEHDLPRPRPPQD